MGVTIHSTTFNVHESYDSRKILNDLAVIHLPENVTFNEFIQPVKLASADLPVGTIVTPSGWGRPSDNDNSISPVLLQVDVPILDSDECNSWYNIIHEGHVCTDGSQFMG